ncbi:bifunctional diguanylate cyclase/phosphodiesterase [Thiobacter aerophilum]|uniref:EAL domain-containing protein n=1 Tax=Thiobacter aerophilum TaxID=3121275 RepID=A0ABV0EDW2_9BURK
MRTPHFHGLRARLFLLLMLAVLPWVVATGYGLLQIRQAAHTEAVAKVEAFATQAAWEQRQVVEEARTFLSVLAALPEVARGDTAACGARLAMLKTRSRGYVNVGVIGPDGRLVCDLMGGAGTYLGDRSYFQAARARRGFVAGHYIIGRVSGQAVMPLASPIVDERGEVTRVIYAAIGADWLASRLTLAALPPATVVTLLDRQGTVVARLPAEPRYLGKPHPAAALVKAAQTGGPGGILEVGGDAPSLIAYTPLDWRGVALAYVAVSVPVRMVEAPVEEALRWRFLLVLGMTLGVFALGWMFAEKTVLAPVRRLRDFSRRLAQGDLSARPEPAGEGELSELTHSLGAMAANLEQSRGMLERIMDVVPEAILVTDVQGSIAMANARCEALFGYRPDELKGQSIELLVPEAQRDLHVRLRAEYWAAPRPRPMGKPGTHVLARRKDGSVFPVDVSLGPLPTEQGFKVVAAVRDASERKRFEEELLRQATHDALTGLPNQMLFRQLLQQAMMQADRDETLLAVMFLDLDGFKTINDTLGHGAGDALLKQVAARIRGAVRAADVVARQGGDEFTLLIAGVRQIPDVTRVADKLLAVVAKPYQIEGREVNVSASIGITLYPLDDADAEHLLRNADTAMYRAKREGRNRYSYYTAEMNAEVKRRLELETGLRRALREGQFEVFYQPQVAVENGCWVGLEALVRWHHPERGLVSPDEFIPVAEDSGLIEPIGEWVLAQVCRQINEWKRRGLPSVRVAVNLSARQFAKPGLLDDVAAILSAEGMGTCAKQIELEVTESILMGDQRRSITLLEGLRAMGLSLSVDDFGTGYSSLSYLKRFPLTALKIDRSFIDGVVDDPSDATIAGAIIDLAHSLHLSVVAEGVETEAQWQWLRAHGCDFAQGYFFGRPMPATEIEARLTARLAEQA